LNLARLLLAEASPWPGGAGDQKALADQAADLENALALIDGRLVLGLLGGTGVGKSALISALAGREISPSSQRRPTTSQAVVYRHESFPPLENLRGREVVHRVDGLRALAIVDFPDFDSLESAHRQAVLDNLRELDLVAWVADQHKYADRRLYEVLARVRTAVSPRAQVVLLNKSDQLLALEDGGEALDYVLESFHRQLRDFGAWAGPPPWPVSARLALAEPGSRAAGGLGPLWDLLEQMADEKCRRAVEEGNLEARSQALAGRLRAAARPEEWLSELESLEALGRDFRPEGAVMADLAGLNLLRPSYLAPRLDQLRRRAGGLLGFFSDLWDFGAGRFRPGPEQPPPAPAPAIPALTRYLLGRAEDLAQIGGEPPSLSAGDLARAGSAVIQDHLDRDLAPAPRPGSALLYLWPPALALVMVWAESGGRYGGPAALTAAALAAAGPWLIFGFLGDLILSRFIWFRARRHYEAAFQRALDHSRAELLELADQSLGRDLSAAGAARRRWLDLWADLENP
jgi:GTP-binding protein EngB required for normal cell division